MAYAGLSKLVNRMTNSTPKESHVHTTSESTIEVYDTDRGGRQDRHFSILVVARYTLLIPFVI